MFRFIGHWVADCVELTCMLAGALLFMQVPALTHAYAVGLSRLPSKRATTSTSARRTPADTIICRRIAATRR